MADIWVMGEMIVEIMRPNEDDSLFETGVFKGPYPSGAPAIFADAAARMGSSVGMIGGVGADDFGKCLLERLKKDNVDTSQVLEDIRDSTGCAFVTYFKDGSRKYIFHMGKTPAVKQKAPKQEILRGIKYFHVMGCSLFANLEFAKEILKTAKIAVELGAKISFDPNIRKELMGEKETDEIVLKILKMTNVFLPGIDELLMLTKKTNIKDAIDFCFENQNLEILALKQGSKGAKIYTRNQEIQACVYKIEPLDATGAGDSFDGVFISSLVENNSIEMAAKKASAAGAINTAAFGPMEGEISQETISKMINYK